MDERWRCYLAELLGTFVLVFFGAGAVCAYFLPEGGRPEVAGVAMAEGFTLAVLLTATLPVSEGCLNPALTLMLWVFKRLDGRRTAGLIVAQLLGAALAGLALRLLFSTDVLAEAHLGVPYLRQRPPVDSPVTLNLLLTGFTVEVVLTTLLACAVFGILFDPRWPRLGGLLPGLAQTAIIVLGFHITGGAANPARWFGPVLWEYTLPGWQTLRPLADHAVYWAGPVVGALLGGYLYSAVILPPDKGRESRR
jgi:glycerol uptake facilitator-like aquaporin